MFDLYCKALFGQPLTFPPGERLSSHRPRASANLAAYIRGTVQLLTFMFLWATLYFILSVSRRGSAGVVGIFLNPPYMVSSLVGIYGCLTLNLFLVGMSCGFNFALCLAWMVFVVLNFAGSLNANNPQAWVVIAYFMPGIVVDLLICILTLPILFKFREEERKERTLRSVTMEASTAEPPPVTVGVRIN